MTPILARLWERAASATHPQAARNAAQALRDHYRQHPNDPRRPA